MPNSALILGHRNTEMGDKILCQRLSSLLNCPLVDLFELLGNYFEPLARLNYELAEQQIEILENLSLPLAKKVFEALPTSDILIILSWCFGISACLALGLHKRAPSIFKLNAHHVDEKIIVKLYEPAALLVTESLLANERALAYGFDPGKLLYIPHCYPPFCENLQPNRNYANQLALSQKKRIRNSTLIFGAVSRLAYGKNCEFAIEAVRRLYESGRDVALILKGGFSSESPAEYNKTLLEMLTEYETQSWFFWDPTFDVHSKAIEHYSSIDVFLHLSGAEAGSNIVVEMLGLKKPVIILDCSTNKYLFSNLATFVKKSKLIQAQIPFYLPDMKDLMEKLQPSFFIPDPLLVQKRFHQEVTLSRLPYLFHRDRNKIEKLYELDRKIYGI